MSSPDLNFSVVRQYLQNSPGSEGACQTLLIEGHLSEYAVVCLAVMTKAEQRPMQSSLERLLALRPDLKTEINDCKHALQLSSTLADHGMKSLSESQIFRLVQHGLFQTFSGRYAVPDSVLLAFSLQGLDLVAASTAFEDVQHAIRVQQPDETYKWMSRIESVAQLHTAFVNNGVDEDLVQEGLFDAEMLVHEGRFLLSDKVIDRLLVAGYRLQNVTSILSRPLPKETQTQLQKILHVGQTLADVRYIYTTPGIRQAVLSGVINQPAQIQQLREAKTEVSSNSPYL